MRHSTEITELNMKYPGFTQSDYEKNKKQIFDTIVSHIEEAALTKSPQVYIKSLQIVDETVDVIATSDQWSVCLTKALDFYKQIEDYESCSICQRLIDGLNKPTKKPKKKNDTTTQD